MDRWTRALIAGATIVAALAIVSPRVRRHTGRGRQKAVDADAGTYTMSGGLIGGWVTTSSKEVATDPYYEATGTERFRGCLDRRRDGKCGANDPSGTLSFSFHLWALMDPNDPTALIWGACWHPVTGGTGDFRGAQGVLTFVDWQVGDSVRTKYLGTITTSGGNAVRARATATAAMRTGC